MAQKVDFDGINRYIILKDGFPSIDVQVDIYSDWKEWWLMGDNSKYPQALRTFGDGFPTFGDIS